jgi:hypothetical protein
MLRVSGQASPTIVTPGSAPLSLDTTAPEVNISGPGVRAVILEHGLSERTEDVRDAARALSREIADQIDFLKSSIPNELDAKARYDDFIAFLRQIAERLDRLAEALDAVINARSSEREPILVGSAADIARSLGAFVREGLEENRPMLKACAIRVPLLGACFAFLHACGLDPTVAFTAAATIMGLSKDGGKK